MNFEISMLNLNYEQKLMLYAKYRENPLNYYAIFSDETKNYRIPYEPSSNEDVTVKIRTGKDNTDTVMVCYNQKEFNINKLYSEGLFDFYSYTFLSIKGEISYYYKILKNNELYYYNKNGLQKNLDEMYNFKIIPDFKTPNWAKGAVMYQIFVDRFYNGDKNNSVKDNEYIYLGKPSHFVSDWYKTPQIDDIRNFYGGDLKGIIDKMDYLKDLGVDALYLNPIFVSPSNHKYDIQDYDFVDPHFGIIVSDGGEPLAPNKFQNKYASMYIKRTTDKQNLMASNTLLVELIRIAHENGIKIILDGVFNHCGAFNKWLDREGIYAAKQNEYYPGAYRDKNSPYHNYFRWYDMNNWPNNDCYDGWWGYDNHPKLNYEDSGDLYNYMMYIAKKWVSPPYNADGWRLDVAADLGYSEEFNHKFWRDFRKAVKSANPDAIIIAEHYGDTKNWLSGDQWDTVMNYDAFMEPITWFLTGMEKHSEEFRSDLLCNAAAFESAMRFHMSRFSIQSLLVSMNELSNHDHSRFLTRTNMQVGRLHTRGAEAAAIGINKGILREAITFQMTWPGSPTIYYGDEVGQLGWSDPDNRRTFPWNREDLGLLSFHKELIKIHKSYDALKHGSVEYLLLDYGIISYGRYDEKDKLVIILNNDTKERKLTVPVWKIGIKSEAVMHKLISSNVHNYFIDRQTYNVYNGNLIITMPAFGSIILI